MKPHKRPQRAYTPELRAKVLALLKGGAAVKKVARDMKIPESSIRWWRDNPEGAAPAEMREAAVGELSDQVDNLRRIYLARASDPRAVQGTSGFYAVQAVQKLTEVHQLLTGGPTQRIAGPWGDLLTQIRDGRAKGLTVIPGGKAAESA